MSFLALTVTFLVAQADAQSSPTVDPPAEAATAIEDPPSGAAEPPAAQPIDDEATLAPEPHADPGDPGDERERPNYDGRSPDWRPSPAIWVPRLVLAPVWVIGQYGLRTPIGATTRWLDREQIVTRVREALTFRNHTIGIFPIFSIANGQRPGFGAYIFADRLFVDWHVMAGTVTTDFSHNIMASIVNRFATPVGALNVRVAYQQRNDLVFYGIGARTLKTDQTRFERHKPLIDVELVSGSAKAASSEASSGSVSGGLAKAEADAPSQLMAGASKHFGTRLGLELSDNRFECSARSPDICGPDRRGGTADDRFTLDRNGDAAFFGAGYALFRVKGLVSIDSRSSGRPESSGIRFDAFGRYGEGLSDRNVIRFFRYGGELSAFVDLSGHRRRVLAARLYIELLENVGSAAKVPFEELIALGGLETMRGFLRARFFGQSAAVASLEYRWPIWSFLDANLFYDLGNVFDHHFRDFDVHWLRGGYGLAFRTNTSRDVAFELMVAAGTKPWSPEPDEFRILFGTNVGF